MPKRRRSTRRGGRSKRRRMSRVRRRRKTGRGLGKLPRKMRHVTPKMFRTVLKYHTEVDIDPELTPAKQLRGKLFLCNSVFQPNVGGHQPMGLDPLFDKYVSANVISSTITVKFYNTFKEASYMIYDAPIVGIITLNTSDLEPYTSLDQCLEQDGCKWIRGRPDGPVTLKSRYTWTSRHAENAMDNANSATVTANPEDIDRWYVFAGSAKNDVSQRIVNAEVTIHYDVVFSNRKRQLMS